MVNNDVVLSQKSMANRLNKIAKKFIPQDEHIILALKGFNREYLFCTENFVYIIKKGFMTGHFLGNGNFKMPYSNITNVEVDFHLITGYFEISAGGLENKDLSTWSANPKNRPEERPNCISLSRDLKKDFQKASEIIMQKVAESKTPSNSVVQTSSSADEIRKYKSLLDEGIITQEEFDKKKKELLNL